jgi:hypothetical protein
MNENFKIEIVDPHHDSLADTSSTSEQGIPSKVIVETMDPAQRPPSTCGSHTPLQRGVKQAPVCRIPALRKEHMSADQLSKHCFEKETGQGMSLLLSRHSFSPKDEEEDKKDKDHIDTNDGNTVTVNPKAWERFKNLFCKDKNQEREEIDNDLPQTLSRENFFVLSLGQFQL